jgi:hypothetical protein
MISHKAGESQGPEFKARLGYIARLCLKKAKRKRLKEGVEARHWQLTPVILATQEAEIRRITVQSQPQANSPRDPFSKKPITKEVLAEWLKVYALNSNPSATK